MQEIKNGIDRTHLKGIVWYITKKSVVFEKHLYPYEI